MELRYAWPSKARDLLLAFGSGVVAGSLVLLFLKQLRDLSFLDLLAGWVGASAPAAFVLGVWRWGRRVLIDGHGITLELSARGPAVRLAWPEVEEIFRIGARGFELRGQGRRIRVSDEFEPLDRAWYLVGRYRGDSLGRELRATFDRGETVRLRGPETPGAALLRGAVLIAFLLPWTIAPLVFALRNLEGLRGDAAFWGIGGALFWSAWLGILLGLALRSTAWGCGWVELDAKGLALRGAGRVRRWAWDELAAFDGLRLWPKRGRPVKLDLRLGNLLFLETLCRRRL